MIINKKKVKWQQGIEFNKNKTIFSSTRLELFTVIVVTIAYY